MTQRGIYQITKRIKLHTKPTRFANIILVGTYKHEKNSFCYFDEFKVRKQNIIDIKPIGKT